jgi:hypothetical protein
MLHDEVFAVGRRNGKLVDHLLGPLGIESELPHLGGARNDLACRFRIRRQEEEHRDERQSQ